MSPKLLVTLSLTSKNEDVHACKCPQLVGDSPILEKWYETSAMVFVGTAEKSDSLGVAYFRANHVYKEATKENLNTGDRSERIRISYDYASSCSIRRFEIGMEYLVYADARVPPPHMEDQRHELRSGMCGTAVLSQDVEDAHWQTLERLGRQA